MEPKIPARIIQTWKSKRLKRLHRKYQRQLRKLNPDYEMMLFTDDEMADFVHQEYPEFSDTFNGLDQVVMRTDLFRLLAVHKFGGFYLDLDVFLVRPLNDLRRESCVFPFERQAEPFFCVTYREMKTLGQFAFGAEPGHPFLMACAKGIQRASSDPEWANPPPPEIAASFLSIFGSEKQMDVFYRTGPVLVTRIYAEQPELKKTIKVLYAYNETSKRFENWCFGVYGIHAMEGSWKTVNAPRVLQRILGSMATHRFVKNKQQRLARCSER